MHIYSIDNELFKSMIDGLLGTSKRMTVDERSFLFWIEMAGSVRYSLSPAAGDCSNISLFLFHISR
jgi:hypothetical protein